MVAQTHLLVLATFFLALVSAASIVVPVVFEAIKKHRRNKDRAIRAKNIVETTAKILESRLDAIAKKDSNRARIVGGSQFLVQRILDPGVTHYLPRGTFDLLMHAAYTAHGILEEAKDGLPRAVSTTNAVLADSRDVAEARSLIESISGQAKMCIIMLQRVRWRVTNDDASDFIDWETERRING